MRELGFRAWDGKLMRCQEELYWNGIDFVMGVWDFNETHIISGEYIPVIMEWTGLKDENGVWIFEGDIVVEKDDNNINAIYYDESRACFVEDRNDHLLSAADPLGDVFNEKKYEVIGNIHQNPELLSE